MFDRQRILSLIPHQGAMCLLETMAHWSQLEILCHTRSHLDPANPLRREGRLAPICGAEYGLQAAALHGALRAGAGQKPGMLAALRAVAIHMDRLDDPSLGMLAVEARLEGADSRAFAYAFRLFSEAGRLTMSGRGVVVLQQPGERSA